MPLIKIDPNAYSYTESKVKDFPDVSSYIAIGGVDVGKTSFAISLSSYLLKKGYSVFFIDLDLGQSTIGLPMTISLGRMSLEGEDSVGFNLMASEFVGNNTPEGIEPLVLSRFYKILSLVPRSNDTKLIIDTCGYINSPRALGYKRSIIEIVQDRLSIIISDRSWARRFIDYIPREKIILEPLPEAKRRDFQIRKERRESLLREYFSTNLTLFYANLYLFYFPYPFLSLRDCLTDMVKYKCAIRKEDLTGLIVGLKDGDGRFLGLGRIIEVTENNLLLETPLKFIREIKFIELSKLRVDNQYREIGKLLISQKEE